MKNIKYLLLIFCFFFIINVNAWDDAVTTEETTAEETAVEEKKTEEETTSSEEVITTGEIEEEKIDYSITDRKSLENYGVHKKWKIKDDNLSNVLATPYVDPSLKIYDYANIINPDDEAILLPLIQEFIEHTHMDMVILTNSFSYSYDIQNETYATDFYDYNDFGIDYANYDGVILFRNANQDQPYYSIYTFGRAQLYFDDDRVNNTLDDIYPAMNGKNYVTAIRLFIEDFTRYYNHGISLTDYYLDDMGIIHQKYNWKGPLGIGFLGGAVIAAIVLGIMVKKNKMIKKAIDAADYMDKGTITYNVKQDILTGTITTHHRISSSSSSGGGGGGGHHSSIGSSGGGHGGGGRHG